MRCPRPGLVVLIVCCFVLHVACRAQTFTQPKVIPTGNWPAAVYSADVNGDGFPDLIYIDQGATAAASTTHILLNDGKGNFTQSAVLATGGDSVAFGDLTSSGHLDLAWFSQNTNASGTTETLFIAAGRGDGTFSPAINFGGIFSGGSLHYEYLATVNLLGTGKPAQIIAEYPNGQYSQLCAFYLNLANPSNTFSCNILPDPGLIQIADLNHDGRPDIVVDGQTTGKAQIFLTSASVVYGNNAFGPTTTTSGAGAIRSLLLRDVNNDGIPDLIAEGANGRIDVFPGNGDGTFQATSIGGTGTLNGLTGNGGHLIAIADLNHDGQLDALTATPAGVSALLGQGTAYFGLGGIYNGGPGHTSYVTADFNGDGNLDLAVDSPEGIAILYGNADGSFQTSLAFAAGQPVTSAALGATSKGSTSLDAVLAVASTGNTVLHGLGNGNFTPGTGATVAQSTPGGLYGSILLGDFTGDGNLDAATTYDGPNAALPTTGNGIILLDGDGNAGFTGVYDAGVPVANPCPNTPGLLYGTASVADLNGDGIADLATRDSSGLRVFFGAPGRTAPVYDSSSLDAACSGLHAHDQVLAADLNNDGLPDLLEQTDGHLLLFLNQGKGVFNYTAPGDLSVDGSLTTAGQLVAPALSSTFGGASPTLGFPAFLGSMAVADLDGDGNNDLAVTYANLSANRAAPSASAPNYLYLWFGSGNGKFLTSAKHPVNPVRIQLSRNYYQVALADLSGDGIPDLILSDGYLIDVQFGNGDGTFGAENHFLAGQGLNSISIADVNGDKKLDLVVANGGTVWTNPVANLDQAPAAQDVATGGITVLLNHANAVPPVSVGGQLFATPEPTQYGSAFSLTLQFNIPASQTAPTGTVTFAIDGNSIGTATATGASVTLPVPMATYATLAIGTHTLSAAYSGDTTYPYAAATYTGTHTVTLIPTSIGLLLCVDPPGSNFPCGNPLEATPLISPISLYYGQVLDGVAVESATNLSGTITFYAGSYVFCVLNANLQQGSNTCPANLGYLTAGTTTDYAAYSGDATHAASNSNSIVVNVLQDLTTGTLTSSLNPAVVGQNVSFTASVQGNYAPAQGQVTFLDGKTTLGTATLDATGTATFPTSTLAIGTHPITISYPGSVNFQAFTSAVLSQVITPLPAVASTVSLVSSLNPSIFGQAVTFTATVTVPAGSGVSPTGAVTFLDGVTPIGSGALSGAGIATFTTSALAIGSHSISAAYAGSASMPPVAAGASPVVIQIVNPVPIPPPSGLTLTVTPSPISVGVGATGVLLASVQEFGGFSAPVALSCSNLPPAATCNFIQPTIAAGGGSTTLQLATTAPHDCNSTQPYFVGSNASGRHAAFALAALFGCILVLPRRRRRLRKTLLLVAVSLGGFAALSGCGHCTDLGTKPGSYTFTVIATPQGSSVAPQSQSIALSVVIQ